MMDVNDYNSSDRTQSEVVDEEEEELKLFPTSLYTDWFFSYNT